MNKLHEIKSGLSRSQVLENLSADKALRKVQSMKSGTIVCWLDHKILFGRITDSQAVFWGDEKLATLSEYIIRLRAFHETTEFYLWRNRQGGFDCRERTDGEGESTDFVDARQLVLGTRSEDLPDGFMRVTEKRGTDFVIPAELLGGHPLDERKHRLVLHTRNYLGENIIGQSGFVDSRFVKIEVSGGSNGKR